jgi:hypothetical protein
LVNNFQLVLFHKYAELLQRKFGEDFQEVSEPVQATLALTDLLKIVSTDDYMPVPIKTREEYDDVVSAAWFVDERSLNELTYVYRSAWEKESMVVFFANLRRFPTVLPFSKMYPLCCLNIRSFAEQFLGFTRENFDYPSLVDETLRKARLPSVYLRSCRSNLLSRPWMSSLPI